MAGFDWWRAAIAGKVGPISEGKPQWGFFRKKDGTPVAIWQDNAGHFHCWSGFKGGLTKLLVIEGVEGYATNFAALCSVWSWVARHPVSEESYRAAFETGSWPDAAPIAKSPTEPKEAVLGGNLPPAEDETKTPLERISAEIDALAETAEAILAKPVASREDADQAAAWSTKMRDAEVRADKQFAVEKAPLTAAAKECDDAWRGPRGKAESLKKRLKLHQEAFLIAEQAKIDAAARAAEREAKRLWDEAQASLHAASQAETTPEEAERLRLEAAHTIAEAEVNQRAAEPQKASAGRVGARVGLVNRTRAVIEDYDKALIALKDAPEVREAVTQAAERMVRNKIAVDGVRAEDYQAVR